MVHSSTPIWEVTEWPTNVAEFMTLPVRFTSRLSRKSMDSLTGGSTPSCIAPATNGKRLYRQKLSSSLRISETRWPSVRTGSGFWVKQVREKGHRDKGMHSCATKCAVETIVL
jgi:hypothetical protein